MHVAELRLAPRSRRKPDHRRPSVEKRYRRERTRGVAGNAAGGFNRGVAVAGDRVFMLKDNAHMISLGRADGELLWETEMADWHQNYNGTSAPLTVGNLVIS